MTIRVLIADDHGVLRAGLIALLGEETDMRVVGEASDGYEALRLATELQPDVVLLDISMPGPDGLQVAEQLGEAVSKARVLILTVHEDEALLRAAIEAGVAGYVPKRAVRHELTYAIRTVCRGDIYIHASLMHMLIDRDNSSASKKGYSPGRLDDCEADVLRLLARGHTNRRIAEILEVSLRTVERRRASIRRKLGSASRVELVHYAREHNLVD